MKVVGGILGRLGTAEEVAEIVVWLSRSRILYAEVIILLTAAILLNDLRIVGFD
jgi:hypothetical protein